ncbi:MAG TPA: 2-amino-4-hydroxy-6-hydroxymethyldihydropteridine diphosphokinase [Chloroflexia bacterium]|nr:2-amino-4-hydroxy-6-hydroxymethyldihydropteridine diphosphokinase [Chloroflexia bacterium]
MEDEKRTIAYLGLGSNMGDREANIEQALEKVDKLPGTRLLRRSPLYESKPWGKTDQADFLNIVAEISTLLEPEALLAHCKQIESDLGRTTGERWGPRPIDIDILLYSNMQVNTPSLTVPHPRMWEREFVLRPLADLTPDLKAPDGASVSHYVERQEIASQGVSLFDLERKQHNVV